MCKALSLIKDFEVLKEKIVKEVNCLHKELSNYDIKEQDILHMIESNERMDACTGYKYAKSIQEIRHNRRIVKNEIEALKALHPISDNVSVVKNNIIQLQNKQSRRVYTPRVLKSVYEK